MANITVERAGRGLPGIPRQRRRAPVEAKFLEATVMYNNGRSAVERTEHNCERGRKAMDDWGSRKLLEPEVNYIAVYQVAKRAQEGGSWR